MPEAGAFRIPPDHPCLPGHFPGRPVVPGVVLLDAAFALIAVHLGAARWTGIGPVKFLAPVLPDQEVAVGYDLTGPGRVAFRLLLGERLVSRGAARFAA